jgi:ribosomal protein S18 acetylase RimI-like enzyme
MTAVLEAAVRRGAATLWLGVWERNPRAQAFYRKYGFVDVGAHTFILGSDHQIDRLMARPLAGAGAG